MSDREQFHIAGGCWCPPERTLAQLRLVGHDESCTRARQGWAANMRHLSDIDRQRRTDEAAGRLMREAAAAIASAAPGETEQTP